MKKIKGSLAIEATIAFTVFLCFMFIIMAIVKLSVVYITLNDVTSETVKKVAGMSYPISYVNDMVDDFAGNIKENLDRTDNEIKKLSEIGSGQNNVYLIQELGKSLDFDNLQNFLNTVSEIKDTFIENILTQLEEFKIDKQTELAANIYKKILGETKAPIDETKVFVKYFSFPQSKIEFENAKTIIAERTGLEESKLSRNDVVLVVEYDYQIALPFFPAFDVKLKSMAIEQAWLKGGNHVTPSEREGISSTDLVAEKTVYWTKSGNGKKYHKEDCMTLKRTSSKDYGSVSEAKNIGLKACKVCKPDEAKEDK